MGNDQYFRHKKLLEPPVRRAAYSDRTAWLMAEMSRLAYEKYEKDKTKLETALSQADFDLIQIFNSEGTQAFLAKRGTDKMAVLAFRGTEKEAPEDIVADLNAKFYKDDNGVKIHSGFLKAFEYIEEAVSQELGKIREYSLYITGHSLGGALALLATRTFNSDNLAACYTFGSPKVGNEEFDDDIKAPIYRIVHAYDMVPFFPPAHFLDLLWLIPCKKLRSIVEKFRGYAHHGDMRYLTFCGDDIEKVKVIANHNDFLRLAGLWMHKKESIKHHAIKVYCEKLGYWALRRLDIK